MLRRRRASAHLRPRLTRCRNRRIDPLAMTFGGAAPLLQSAMTIAGVEHSDVANSFLPVTFNFAIFAAGGSGALLLQALPPRLAVWMAVFGALALGLAIHGRRPRSNRPRCRRPQGPASELCGAICMAGMPRARAGRQPNRMLIRSSRVAVSISYRVAAMSGRPSGYRAVRTEVSGRSPGRAHLGASRFGICPWIRGVQQKCRPVFGRQRCIRSRV